MDNKFISKNEIETLQTFVLGELEKDYLPDARNLNMPGLEVILIMIANKIVLPIVTSVGGRFAYDKIDKWRKGELKKEDVIEQTTNMNTGDTEIIPEAQVVSEIVADLQKDGIPVEKAKALAERSLEKFKALRQ